VDVSGAAEDGSLKVHVLFIDISHPRPTHAHHPPRLPLCDGAMHSKICGSADIPERLNAPTMSGAG